MQLRGKSRRGCDLPDRSRLRVTLSKHLYDVIFIYPMSTLRTALLAHVSRYLCPSNILFLIWTPTFWDSFLDPTHSA